MVAVVTATKEERAEEEEMGTTKAGKARCEGRQRRRSGGHENPQTLTSKSLNLGPRLAGFVWFTHMIQFTAAFLNSHTTSVSSSAGPKLIVWWPRWWSSRLVTDSSEKTLGVGEND